MYDEWGPQEAVDGAGRSLPDHAAGIAAALALTPEQAGILVAELRNALVPAVVAPANSRKSITRVLALADALAAKAQTL